MSASVTEVLAQPLAGQLLRGSPLARLAYVGPDGRPRVVPVAFLWRDGQFLVWTISTSAKVRALQARPEVAVTVDHDGYPPRALLLHGTASVTIVPGVPDGYVQASLKTESSRSADDFGAAVRSMYTEMAEIAITPTWARLNDFQTTLPRAVEDVLRGLAERG